MGNEKAQDPEAVDPEVSEPDTSENPEGWTSIDILRRKMDMTSSDVVYYYRNNKIARGRYKIEMQEYKNDEGDKVREVRAVDIKKDEVVTFNK